MLHLILNVRKLTERNKNEVSSVELKLSDGADIETVKEKIKNKLGENFSVKNRYEQREFLNKIMKSEKWAMFIILIFIIIIASFSIMSSVTMLIIAKKKDIVTLRSFGADNFLINKIFFLEGWLISVTGAFLGLIIGGIITYIQQEFEIITFPDSGNFLLNAYPVEIRFIDFILTFSSVSAVGFFLILFPVRLIKNRIF